MHKHDKTSLNMYFDTKTMKCKYILVNSDED